MAATWGTTRRFCPLETNQQRSSEQGRAVVVSPRLLASRFHSHSVLSAWSCLYGYLLFLCFFASSPSRSLSNCLGSHDTRRPSLMCIMASQVSGRRRNRGAPKTRGGVETGKGGGRGRGRQPGKRNELPRTRRKSTTAMQEILRSNTYTMHRDPPNPRPASPYHPQLPVFRTPTRNPSGVCTDRETVTVLGKESVVSYLSSFVLLSTLPYLWCRYPSPLRPLNGNNNGLGGQINAFVPSLQCCSFAFTSDMIHVLHPFFKLQPKTTLS